MSLVKNNNIKQNIRKTRIITDKVWVSQPKLKYRKNNEEISECLCAFCCVDKFKEKPAETMTDGYLMPCCKDCNEFLQLQEQYLWGIEKEWLMDLYRKVHNSLLKHGYDKIIEKEVEYCFSSDSDSDDD